MGLKLASASSSADYPNGEWIEMPVVAGLNREIYLNPDNKRHLEAAKLLTHVFMHDAQRLIKRANKMLSDYAIAKGQGVTLGKESNKKLIKTYAARYFLMSDKGWGRPETQARLNIINVTLGATAGFFQSDMPIRLVDSDKFCGQVTTGTALYNGQTHIIPKSIAATAPVLSSSSSMRSKPAVRIKPTLDEVRSFELSVHALLRSRRSAVALLIHEASHAFGSTDDNGYLKMSGKAFRDERPGTIDEAIKNADSIAWFVIKVARTLEDTWLYEPGLDEPSANGYLDSKNSNSL